MLLPQLHPNRTGQQNRWQLQHLGRSTAASRQDMTLAPACQLRQRCQASCCTAGGAAGLNALAILPDYRSGDVRRSGPQYSHADRWKEGFGSVLGRAALLKSADLRFDAAAADSVLNEVGTPASTSACSCQLLQVQHAGAARIGGRPALHPGETHLTPICSKQGTASAHGTQCTMFLRSQVVAYQRLQRLQGLDVAGLEAAGMLDHEVFLAVSGGERPERPSSGPRLLRRPQDPRDMPPPAKWAALDALRRIHDAGVLHRDATSRSLLLRRRQVAAETLNPAAAALVSALCTSCRRHAAQNHGHHPRLHRTLFFMQASCACAVCNSGLALAAEPADLVCRAGIDVAAAACLLQVSHVREPRGPLLWADFGDSRIVPGLNRHSAAALDEAFTAALSLNEPAWLFHNLLQPAAAPSAAMASAACGGVPPQELPMAALLPNYDGSGIIMGSPAGASAVGRLHHGSVLGRPAVINAAALALSPLTARIMADEVCHRISGLAGLQTPRVRFRLLVGECELAACHGFWLG